MSQAKSYKLVVNVPVSHADDVRQALGDAGAGQVGNYHHCSFSVRGIGRFCPNDLATPFIGAAGQMEQVEEEQIQVNVNAEKLPDVLAAMRASHPYEEIGFDVFERVDVSALIKTL